MWIVYGTQTRTERVPNGLRVERDCDACGETAMFYERRVSRSFTLYFLPVFDTRRERVLACGACGAHVRTDEHGAADEETRTAWEDALARTGGAFERAEAALAPAAQNAARAAADMLASAADSVSPAMRRAAGGVGGMFARLRDDLLGEGPRPSAQSAAQDEPEDAERPDDDVLYDPEKADLLRRFAELEKKHGK